MTERDVVRVAADSGAGRPPTPCRCRDVDRCRHLYGVRRCGTADVADDRPPDPPPPGRSTIRGTSPASSRSATSSRPDSPSWSTRTKPSVPIHLRSLTSAVVDEIRAGQVKSVVARVVDEVAGARNLRRTPSRCVPSRCCAWSLVERWTSSTIAAGHRRPGTSPGAMRRARLGRRRGRDRRVHAPGCRGRCPGCRSRLRVTCGERSRVRCGVR